MRLNEGARCESRRMRRAHALSRVELGFLRQIKCHKCYSKYYIWYTHHIRYLLGVWREGFKLKLYVVKSSFVLITYFP